MRTFYPQADAHALMSDPSWQLYVPAGWWAGFKGLRIFYLSENQPWFEYLDKCLFLGRFFFFLPLGGLYSKGAFPLHNIGTTHVMVWPQLAYKHTLLIISDKYLFGTVGSFIAFTGKTNQARFSKISTLVLGMQNWCGRFLSNTNMSSVFRIDAFSVTKQL